MSDDLMASAKDPPKIEDAVDHSLAPEACNLDQESLMTDIDLSPSIVLQESLEGVGNQQEPCTSSIVQDVEESSISSISHCQDDKSSEADQVQEELPIQEDNLSITNTKDSATEADHDQIVPATLMDADTISSSPLDDEQSSKLANIITNEDQQPLSHNLHDAEIVPSSHPITEDADLIGDDDDVLSPSVAFQRTESIKENPFTRLSESQKDDKDPSLFEDEDLESEVVPKVEDVELSKPVEISKPQASPMVVSVGTIEVNGSNQYEDINIMSKGTTIDSESIPAKKEDSNDNKEFESLRDLRFSSISIYDKPHFEEDIIITVDDAQKHAAESFVSYKVVTKTTRESFLQHEFHVRRRYQDFLWLSNILVQQYPSNIIPPLPQKKIFNKYDPNFLRLRQLALNKFLCRIAEHPILSASEHFFTFLSAKQVELIEQKKTTNLKKFSIPQLPITDPDSPFKKTSEYIDEFGKILSTLSTQSTKLDKEQSELENALNALSPSLALWANSEGDLEPILSKLGESVSKNSEDLAKLVKTKEEIFSEGIKEYQLYCNTVKSVLKNRDHMQVTKDYFTNTVLSKQKELEKLETTEPGKSIATLFGKSPAQVKQEKMTKLKDDITKLSADGEVAGDELVVASASIRSDIERWKINKEKDFRSLLQTVADANIENCRNNANVWESMLMFIDDMET